MLNEFEVPEFPEASGSVRATSTDNTRYVDMIHPVDGGIVPIAVSPRHFGGQSVEYYRSKGFMTIAEAEAEKARNAEIEALRAENASLKAGKPAPNKDGK